MNNSQRSIFLTFFLLCSIDVLGDFFLFDIQQNQQELEPIILSEPTESGSVEKIADGSWKFSLKGGAGTEVRWYIPVKMEVFSKCKVHFEVISRNIRTFGDKPTLQLTLNDAQDPQSQANGNDFKRADQVKEIPIFSSVGSQDSAVGRLPLNKSEELVFIDGFYLDFGLIDGGEGEINLKSLNITTVGNLFTEEEVNSILELPPPVQAEVKKIGSKDLVLNVNNKRISSLGYSSGNDTNDSHYQSMVDECGINLVRTIVNLGGDNPFFPGQKSVWHDPDYIDFPSIESSLRKACLNENTYVIIDVLLNTPPNWWLESETAKRVETNNIMLEADSGESSWQQFIVSDLDASWMDYGESALKQLFAFIRKRPYARSVIGCNVIAGIGMNDFPPQNRDHHPVYATSFQEWLLAKYRNINSLRKSWKMEIATFSDAFPEYQEHWNKGDLFSFVHPTANKQAMDSQLFYYISWTNTLLDYCRLIKSLSQGHYLTGIVGGPALMFNSLWNNSYQPTSEALDPIFQSEDVDYMETPVSSMDLRNGNGANGMEFLLSDELRKYKKLLFLRNTIPFEASHFHGGNINEKDMIQIQRRIFIASLINNSPMYFFQTNPNGYQNALIKKEINQFQTISEKALKLSNGKKAELAFVIDFDVFKYLAPNPDEELITSEDFDSPETDLLQIPYTSSSASPYFYLLGIPMLTWNRIGVPYDIVDIDDAVLDQYKTVFMYHTLFLDDHRETIINSCKNNDRYLISIWANGIATERYLTATGVQKATGMTTKMVPESTQFKLMVQPELEDVLDRPVRGTALGWLHVFREPKYHLEKTFGPLFHVDDERARVLATYPDMKRGGMAEKSFSDWTSIYSASPVVNPEIMKELVRKSNAHIYLESNDLLFVNDSFIGIHSLTDGVRQLNLPDESALYEIFRNQELKKNRIHRIHLQGRKTYLFFRGKQQTWESL